jgi:hypothetical protein
VEIKKGKHTTGQYTVIPFRNEQRMLSESGCQNGP